jgi:hypothetical protein
MDLENLKKMSSSVLARLVKLWTPWWLLEEGQEYSKLGLSNTSLKKRGNVEIRQRSMTYCVSLL